MSREAIASVNVLGFSIHIKIRYELPLFFPLSFHEETWKIGSWATCPNTSASRSCRRSEVVDADAAASSSPDSSSACAQHRGLHVQRRRQCPEQRECARYGSLLGCPEACPAPCLWRWTVAAITRQRRLLPLRWCLRVSSNESLFSQAPTSMALHPLRERWPSR